MKDMDLPVELLEDEDPTQTIPRRFGLSDVVGRQIRSYKDDVRKRVRLNDEEIRGLFRFVIRRPDGPEVFHQVGRLLANTTLPSFVTDFAMLATLVQRYNGKKVLCNFSVRLSAW